MSAARALVGGVIIAGAGYMLLTQRAQAEPEYIVQPASQPAARQRNDYTPLIGWGLEAVMNWNRNSNNTGRKTDRRNPLDALGALFGGRNTTNATASPRGASATGSIASWFGQGLPPSVIGTESGGRATAYNHERGAGGHYGHGGRGQFGTARLHDAYRAGVLPRRMTAAEYAKQPLSVQAKVEKWHVKDIGNYVERNGLDRYIGQTVNGVRVTPNGMIAAAHLGGSGGLKKWLKSGRNPSDAYGTSLTDYMRTHEGYL